MYVVPDSLLPVVAAGMPMTVVDVDGVVVHVPSLLDDCFSYILSNALVEGIFRVSGSARRMKLISADYSRYHEWLASETKPNSHDVAGVIKKYLRVYLDSMDGLFTSSCLSQLQRLYLSHTRSDSEFSFDSFKSATTSLGSPRTLPSVVEDAEYGPTVTNPETLLDAVSHLLITKNLSAKNDFFIYLLLQLKQLSLHEDKTKMTVSNLSIIFQPYIFNTKSLSELEPFQNFLTFLVINYDNLVQKYVCYKNILGGLEELDADEISITSSESLVTSPLTVYSSHQGSPSKNSSDRRKSISQRFSTLWDAYNLPANRSRRFSLNFGSKSAEKLASSENITRERRPTAIGPHELLRSNENLTEDSDLKTPTLAGKGPELSGPIPSIQVLETAVPQRPPMPKRASSKRKSFIGMFRSTLSVNSIPSLMQNDALSPFLSQSPQTPPVNELSANGLNASVDNLLISDQTSPLLQPDQKRVLGRSFSMRLRRK